MRRMPSAPPNSPASNTTLSRGDASPDGDASVGPVVLGKDESREVDLLGELDEPVESRTPGLNVVVQGSTSAMSASPRVIASSSFACLPDDPRKMRGFHARLMMTHIAPTLHGGAAQFCAVRPRRHIRRCPEGRSHVSDCHSTDSEDGGLTPRDSLVRRRDSRARSVSSTPFATGALIDSRGA